MEKEDKLFDVQTGEIKVCGNECVLKSGAIGSCVVVVAYDTHKKLGGVAHIMLPGKSRPLKEGNTVTPVQCKGAKASDIDIEKTRYAVDAIDYLAQKIQEMGSKLENLEVCLIGGANVLKREGDTIGRDNILSVKKLLNLKNIKIVAESLGGTERRSMSLEVSTGTVRFTQGDGKETVLWPKADKEPEVDQQDPQ